MIEGRLTLTTTALALATTTTLAITSVLVVPSWRKRLITALVCPSTPFDDTPPPPAPDYTHHGPSSWAAFPGREQGNSLNPAELHPEDGEGVISEPDRPCDCFYLNPTTYLAGPCYNCPLTDSWANFGIDVCLATQASCFNNVCRIYAPRYRQVTLAGAYYSSMPMEDRLKAYEVAYSDVRRAFQYFLDHLNGTRPFVIASHSQGTRHATRLISECVEGCPAVRERFVAGYLIGGGLATCLLPTLQPCQGPEDLGCVIGWDTVPSNYPIRRRKDLGGASTNHHWLQDKYRNVKDVPCHVTNPLTWTTSPHHHDDATTPPPQAKHLGVVRARWGGREDGRYGVIGLHGPQPIKDHVNFQVRVEGDYLVVPPLTGMGLYSRTVFGGTYHLTDYALFYFNIRENVHTRVQAFLKSHPNMKTHLG